MVGMPKAAVVSAQMPTMSQITNEYLLQISTAPSIWIVQMSYHVFSVTCVPMLLPHKLPARSAMPPQCYPAGTCMHGSGRGTPRASHVPACARRLRL